MGLQHKEGGFFFIYCKEFYFGKVASIIIKYLMDKYASEIFQEFFFQERINP